MTKANHVYWGRYHGQTVGQKGKEFYIKGYDSKGNPTEIVLYTTEFPDLMLQMHRAQEKYRCK